MDWIYADQHIFEIVVIIGVIVYYVRNGSFKEFPKKYGKLLIITYITFMFPSRLLNTYFFEELHGRKPGQVFDKGNIKHHSPRYDECLKGASLITVFFCEQISGDNHRTIETECVKKKIYSSRNSLCGTLLKEKFKSFNGPDYSSQELEYVKRLMRKVEKEKRPYPETWGESAIDIMLKESNSKETVIFLIRFALQLCLDDHVPYGCILISRLPKKKTFDSYSFWTLDILGEELRLYLIDTDPKVANKENRSSVIHSLSLGYSQLRKELSDKEIDLKIDSFFKMIGLDISDEIKFYYKKALNLNE